MLPQFRQVVGPGSKAQRRHRFRLHGTRSNAEAKRCCTPHSKTLRDFGRCPALTSSFLDL
jgi:hypothetical protein